MKKLLLLLSLLSTHLTLSANPFSSPEKFIKGFDAVLGLGMTDYAVSWYKAAPLSNEVKSEKAKASFATLRKFDEDYGKILEIKVLEKQTIAESSSIIYLVAIHERGAVFYFFKLSEDGHGWLLTEYRFNSNPERILPERLLKGK